MFPQSKIQNRQSKIASLLRQKRLGLSDFRPICIGFCADRHKLGVVGLGFLAVAGSLGGSGCSVEPPVAVRVLLERRLELAQRPAELLSLPAIGDCVLERAPRDPDRKEPIP